MARDTTAEGILLWVNEATGYGLIRPDDGGRDLLVHPTELGLGKVSSVEEGTEVAYEVRQSRTMRVTRVDRKSRYSWLDACCERHEGKEARNKYYEGL